MKLNDTTVLLTARTRCCFNAFVEHFTAPEQPEDVVELIEQQAEFNPDVQVGDNFECPHCKNTILLNERSEWEAVDPKLTVDLTEPAQVVAAEI